MISPVLRMCRESVGLCKPFTLMGFIAEEFFLFGLRNKVTYSGLTYSFLASVVVGAVRVNRSGELYPAT